MAKNTNSYRRDSLRLQKWDYRWAGSYFITICSKLMIPYFGRIENNEMILSEIGQIAFDYWFNIVDHAKEVELGAFVVMPDHIHGIITLKKNTFEQSKTDDNNNDKLIGQKRFQNQGKNSVSSIIGGYKSSVTKKVRSLGYQFYWHSGFYEKIIRDETTMKIYSEYIKNNIITK